MNIVQKSLKLKPEDYYKTHLRLLNSLSPFSMTENEIEVLAAFLELDNSIADEYRFNTLARKKVMGKLGLAPGGLGNYLKALIKKKVLIKSEITNLISVPEFLLADDIIQGYQIKIMKENEVI